MRLKHTAGSETDTRRLSVADEEGNLLGFVDLDERGRIRTTAELGERAAEQYADLEITDRETSDPDSDDSEEDN